MRDRAPEGLLAGDECCGLCLRPAWTVIELLRRPDDEPHVVRVEQLDDTGRAYLRLLGHSVAEDVTELTITTEWLCEDCLSNRYN